MKYSVDRLCHLWGSNTVANVHGFVGVPLRFKLHQMLVHSMDTDYLQRVDAKELTVMHADHSVSRLTGPGHPVTSVGPWTWHTAWTRKKLTLCLTRTHQRRCLSGARVRVKVREVRGRTGQS